jgi:hypothetical protein
LQKERVPINIEFARKNNTERNSQMTENAVDISINVILAEWGIKTRQEIKEGDDLDESIQELAHDLALKLFKAVIQSIDDHIARQVPEKWRNVGTEERTVISSVGVIDYHRRIYLDEAGRRRKPVDELLGIRRYGRITGRVQKMGAYLASEGSYRRTAEQMSWQLKTPFSHTTIQRLVWEIGNRIADEDEAENRRIFECGESLEAGKVVASVLCGESDGVHLHLQREQRKSTEVRVAVLSSGRKAIGKGRYQLENKCCLTSIGQNSQEWQESILRTAHSHYDLSRTHLCVTGGDGNAWVRHSFDRLGIPQEFILDRFHLHRAARRAIQDRAVSTRIVTTLRQEGFPAARQELEQMIKAAAGKKRKKLLEFYKYVFQQQDILLDLDRRGYTCSAHLGAIEGNVDKLVVHRMKGRGCSWRLRGVRAMLAVCRHRDELRQLAYTYRPVNTIRKVRYQSSSVEVDYSEITQRRMPIFHGPHQDKPWVRSLYNSLHGRPLSLTV